MSLRNRVFLGIVLFGLILSGFETMSPARDQERPAPQARPNADVTELSIELIMRGEDFVGSEPSNPVWAVDGKTLYFQWKKPGASRSGLYAVSASEPVPRPVDSRDLLKLPPFSDSSSGMGRRYGYGGAGGDIDFDETRKRAVFVQNGDIFLLNFVEGTAKQLTSTDEREANAQFTADEKGISFTMSENLFLLSLEDGSLRQMTSFSRRTPPERREQDEIDKWYAEQQRELFTEIQGQRRFGRSGGATFPQLSDLPRRKPHILKESERVTSLALSPDGKFVTFAIYESPEDPKNTIVPAYVTRSGYTETLNSHAKAAYSGQNARAGIVDIGTGEVKWIDFGLGDRKFSPRGVLWSPDGKRSVVTAWSEDRKDVWLFSLDPTAAKTTLIFHVKDEAWVGQLGLTNLFWWPDSRHVSFISEKEGYAHLYKATVDGDKIEAMTHGRFEVRSARLSKDGRLLYLTTNEEHPGELHFYSMPAAGGAKTKITSLVGLNEAFLSPDESSLAILHSYSTSPAELYLQANNPKAEAKRVTLSTSKAFQSYPWYDPEIIRFKARDGVDIYARLFTPVNLHSSRPAVIFIHGAGYLQNAHKGWSSYYREYMFHNFLMEQGYYVLDVDYRGSSGYGRDFRTGIYRHMGGKDLDDIVDAAKFLVDELDVDPARIGCYGGSYGGFLTLMAMFTAPETFKAGAALRPVTDWAHYHAGYTVDILNLPHQDPEAYKRSSPIYFAEGLQGALLICHGMVDTNVHFQDTVRLTQRLIELGKENWEVAVYPVESHSFTTTSAWTDEYKRIFKLFETHLK